MNEGLIAYEEHGHDDAAGDVGAGGPAGHQEVDGQHGRHARVPKLLVGVLRVQVVHGLHVLHSDVLYEL